MPTIYLQGESASVPSLLTLSLHSRASLCALRVRCVWHHPAQRAQGNVPIRRPRIPLIHRFGNRLELGNVLPREIRRERS